MNKYNINFQKSKPAVFFLLTSVFALFAVIFFRNQMASGQVGREIFDCAPTVATSTLIGFNGAFETRLSSKSCIGTTKIEMLDLRDEPIPLPWKLNLISGIYQFNVSNKRNFDNKLPYSATIAYENTSPYYKQVFYYDKFKRLWFPLPSKDLFDQKKMQVTIRFPFIILAVFEKEGALLDGKASWYKYKDGNFAASPDFPIGSQLKVTNIKNNKSVSVVVNDNGPDRSKHPDRVVDLDKFAFQQIGDTKDGVIQVRVEPLYIKSKDSQTVLDINQAGESDCVEAKVKSAIVVDEASGNVIYAKNATTSLPLASLTKLVAAKVFLDTKPDFKKVVEYKRADENWNYKYVDNKWESARLKVAENETMTIEDLFYSAIVGSANNAIESLVRVSGLGRDEFIGKMNAVVKEWGAYSTYFLEPTGLSPQNISSAYDYAIITREVMKDSRIQKASSILEYSFTTKNTKKKHTIRNTNALVRGGKYNITGTKTGFLYEAGYCLMTRVKTKKGNSAIVITFGAGSNYTSIKENEKLINYSLRKL